MPRIQGQASSIFGLSTLERKPTDPASRSFFEAKKSPSTHSAAHPDTLGGRGRRWASRVILAVRNLSRDQHADFKRCPDPDGYLVTHLGFIRVVW